MKRGFGRYSVAYTPKCVYVRRVVVRFPLCLPRSHDSPNATLAFVLGKFSLNRHLIKALAYKLRYEFDFSPAFGVVAVASTPMLKPM